MRTLIEIIVGVVIFMLGATLGMMVTCLVIASKDGKDE